MASLAFSPDGKLLFAWDAQKAVWAWSTETGEPADAVDPPLPLPGPARSPDGSLEARAAGRTVEVTDTRLADSKANHWPFPDAAERKAYHTARATLAEKDKQWFAAAFHLGRLLLDDPDNADLKRRHDTAARSARDRPEVAPPPRPVP